MSESTTDPKLAALEKSLATLMPAPGRIDRDQLLFRAGQASMQRQRWLWPSSTALVTLVAVGLGIALALRPASPIVERVVYVPAGSPISHSDSRGSVSPSMPSQRGTTSGEDIAWGSSSAYLHDRDQAIRWGVETLPPSPAIASSKQASFIESILGLPEKKADDAELFRFRF
jgi:hypothetical protein